MKKLITILALLTIAFIPASVTAEKTTDTKQCQAFCCKTCKKGKACGDSCISKSKTCHKGKGCACNG